MENNSWVSMGAALTEQGKPYTQMDWKLPPEFRLRISPDTLEPDGGLAIYGVDSFGKEWGMTINFPSKEALLVEIERLRTWISPPEVVHD